MAEVQRYDTGTSSWVTIENARWRIENGISTKLPAPRATIEASADANISANDEVRVRDGTTDLFDGFARSGGEYGEAGSVRYECRDDAYKILDEEVSLSLTNTTDEQVISSALSNTELGANWTFTYYPTSANSIGDYSVDSRKFKVILKDMIDRTGLVWRFDASRNLHVGQLGRRGTWKNVETGVDDIRIEKWNDGDIATIQNEVTVQGTGADPVSATDTHSTSISNYGRQSVTYSYRWITTATEALNTATELLIPDPLESGKVLFSEAVGGVYQNLANYNVTLTDSTRGISSEIVVVEKQVLQEGRTTLHVGQGAGYAESQINRDSQSGQDAIRQNYTQLEGTLDDIDDGSTYGKILDSAISSGRHTLSAAVGDLDNIDDGGTYARVRDGNVDADNYVLLATSIGDLDNIDDGSTYGRVVTTALDAGEIILAEANGDLDDIQDGTNFGKVDITHLTSGGAVFATGIELDDGRDLSQITADDGGVTVIDGGEILTGSITANAIDSNTITANEISTLDLETQDISIGNESTSDGSFEFDLYQFPDGTYLPRLYPSLDGYGELGRSGNWFSNLYVQQISTDNVDASSMNASGEFSALNGEMEILGDWRSTQADFDFLIGENPMSGKTGPAIWPSSSSRAEVGTGDGTTEDKAIGSVHTINLYQYSPEPLSPDDPRTDTPADGGRPIDLDELKSSTWYDPPKYAAQGKDVETGEYEKNPKREDGTRGVELGHMTNYIFEVTKRLAEERDQLQEQVNSLEKRLSQLEAQVGE